jgi:hypothetical protein
VNWGARLIDGGTSPPAIAFFGWLQLMLTEVVFLSWMPAPNN